MDTETAFAVLRNDQGAIVLAMNAHSGVPESPRLLFDGVDSAMLYRSRGKTIRFSQIHRDVVDDIRQLDQLIVAEWDQHDMKQAYQVPVKHVERLP